MIGIYIYNITIYIYDYMCLAYSYVVLFFRCVDAEGTFNTPAMGNAAADS